MHRADAKCQKKHIPKNVTQEFHAKESRGPNVSTILLACLDSSNAFY
jgi:hypothetical protein